MKVLSEAGLRRVRLVAWIVATVLIVVLVRAVDPRRALALLGKTNGWWLVLAVASNACIQPFGAMQWRSFLPTGIHVSKRRMFKLFSVTSIANNTTPSLIGHATGTVLLAAQPGVGKAASLQVLTLDQIAVGLVKMSLVGAAGTLLHLPPWMERAWTALATLVGVLVVVAIVVARRTSYLDVLRRPLRLASGLGFALCVKVAEAGAIFAVQRAFGVTPTVQSIVVVLAASALGSTVPIAPANIGTYEAASFGAYRYLGVDAELALGIAVIQHACQLLPAVGVGYLLLGLPRSWSTDRVSPPDEESGYAPIHEV